MLFVSRLPWFCEIMPLGRTQLARMPGLRPRQARIEPAPRKKAQGGHLFHREGADLPRLSHDEARDAAHGDSLLRGSLPPSARLPLRTYKQGQQPIANGLEERTRCCRHRTKHKQFLAGDGITLETERRAAASGERGDQDSQARAGSNSSPGASTSRGTACYTAAGSTTTTTRGSGERGKQ